MPDLSFISTVFNIGLARAWWWVLMPLGLLCVLMNCAQSDKAMAHDKAGKLEATERKHERQAVAQHSKDQKQVDNAHQAGQVKQDIKEGKATSHQPDLTSANPMTNQGLAAQGGTAGLSQAPGPGAATPV
jgi:cytochrome c biogenesis protein ResB